MNQMNQRTRLIDEGACAEVTIFETHRRRHRQQGRPVSIVLTKQNICNITTVTDLLLVYTIIIIIIQFNVIYDFESRINFFSGLNNSFCWCKS